MLINIKEQEKNNFSIVNNIDKYTSIKITSNFKFVKRLWCALKAPFTYLFFGWFEI